MNLLKQNENVASVKNFLKSVLLSLQRLIYLLCCFSCDVIKYGKAQVFVAFCFLKKALIVQTAYHMILSSALK